METHPSLFNRNQQPSSASNSDKQEIRRYTTNGKTPIAIQPRPCSSSNSGERTPTVPTMRDRGFQETMAIQQSLIEHQLNLPNFSPNFSLLSSFNETASTTSNTFQQQRHQQPIYNMGTIHIHNHYSAPRSPPRRKRLRIMSDSEDDE